MERCVAVDVAAVTAPVVVAAVVVVASSVATEELTELQLETRALSGQ